MPIKLTKLEQKVHDHVMLGITPTDIAYKFGVMPNRIHKTLGRIYFKRKVSGVQQLMALRIKDLEDQLHMAYHAGVDDE